MCGYELLNYSVLLRLVLSQNCMMNNWTWVDRTQGWILCSTAPADNCDFYAYRGAYGSCNLGNSPICGFLGKIVPRHPKEWAMGD